MKPNNTRSILVTGASGYIGRHVLAELAARGIACHALFRQPPTSLLPSGITPIVGDIAHDIPDLGFTHCLHLAWGGLPDYHARTHLDIELPKHQVFLARLMARGLRQLVVTGTCLEYGMQSGALREDMAIAPTLPYAQAKAALFDWLMRNNPAATNLCWARLFYSYGEGQHANALYSQFCAAIARANTTFAMSGGQQQRDYLPVSTVAAYLVDMLLFEGDHGVVNICSGTPITVEALVQQWVRAYGHAITLELGRYPYPDYEPMAFWGDNAKLMRIIHQGAQHGAT
jgi:dTDP-6-deoxy-L-talose 4-dehydrogenase (NAD+)